MTTSEFALPDSSAAVRFPDWQLEYQDVLFELDPTKLAERVADAEVAIFKRLQALSQRQNGPAERQAIEGAILALRVIKRGTLAFPDWESNISLGP
jgi:hypothetical protein